MIPQILLVVGAVLAVAGIGGIAAGAPDWLLGLSLGATLIQSGMIALVGGLLLVAISFVLTALQDVLRRLEALGPGAPASVSRPSARSLPAPDSAAPERAARQTPAEPAPAAREEAPDVPEEPVRPRRMPSRFAAEESARARAEAAREHPAEEMPRPRREALQIISAEEPRPRRERGLEQTGEDIDRLRGALPFRPARDAGARPRRDAGLPPLGDERRRSRLAPEEPAPSSGETYVPKFRPAEQAPKSERGPASETVVRSGVIGGMAYTLYADGSIEAELPIGTVRFASVADLQDHVTRTGAEADRDFDEQNR
ncbi:MAG: hypothetical protein IT539_03830 [Bradyrhizobiaceae bacterium]|nr:hypothetical protein [Bradyrhizobiaceae bacterium]